MRAGEQGGQKSARKPERIFVEGGAESIPLDPQSEVTHFLERIRDQVHRSVITFHRTKRSQRVFQRQRLMRFLGLGRSVGDASLRLLAVSKK